MLCYKSKYSLPDRADPLFEHASIALWELAILMIHSYSSPRNRKDKHSQVPDGTPQKCTKNIGG